MTWEILESVRRTTPGLPEGIRNELLDWFDPEMPLDRDVMSLFHGPFFFKNRLKDIGASAWKKCLFVGPEYPISIFSSCSSNVHVPETDEKCKKRLLNIAKAQSISEIPSFVVVSVLRSFTLTLYGMLFALFPKLQYVLNNTCFIVHLCVALLL